MLDLGEYDVLVAGAGVTGIVASVAAARQGSNTCLIESSGVLGGLITGGRLTKPTGVIQAGVYKDLVNRAAAYGGADPSTRVTPWGSYSGIWDPEIMQRVVIEILEESHIDVLLYAHAVDVLKAGRAILGVQLQTKAGAALVRGKNVIDSTGDGDVAALAGAEFSFGRTSDGLTQPMTSYFRVVNVDIGELVNDCTASGDYMELVAPQQNSGTNGTVNNGDQFFCRGFVARVKKAQDEGFNWILPKRHITLKSGMMAGEINVNATRVHGSALDPVVRSSAAIEVRKQAYCVMDFLKKYVSGFAHAHLLEISTVLGVRETRRIIGDYILSASDVRSHARFDDAIGLCTDPIDIHEPGGEGGTMDSVGIGYGIPYRALLVHGIDNLLVAGRCISVDEVAYGSTRNTPACALTGQAAGVAAALSTSQGVAPRRLPVEDLQDHLGALGIVLGTTEHDRMPATAVA